MFGTKQVPAVGVSLGIERVFTIMEQLHKEQNQVIVTYFFRLGQCTSILYDSPFIIINSILCILIDFKGNLSLGTCHFKKKRRELVTWKVLPPSD